MMRGWKKKQHEIDYASSLRLRVT